MFGHDCRHNNAAYGCSIYFVDIIPVTMPELPEIETIKLQLQQVLPGKEISNIEVLKERTVVGDWKPAVGKKVREVRRKGKVLIIDLSGDISIAFHFKMTGQLVYTPSLRSSPTPGGENLSSELKGRIVGGHPTKDYLGELPSKHTRVVISFGEARLYFNDQRLFGWMKVGNTSDVNKMNFLEKMGPEIWDVDEKTFVEKLRRTNRSVKLAIMDQELLSGVGNIYANDACWMAQINPSDRISLIPNYKLQKLYAVIKEVLEEGIKYGGATASDAKYIDLHGMGGHYQDHFKVYDRKGKPCLRDDGGVIEKTQMGGRGTYWCPVCQHG